MRFNGLERDGVVCTDDLCLMKYFDPPLAPVMTLDGRTATVVGVSRNRPDWTDPAGRMRYLRNPPQVRGLARDVDIVLRGLTRLPGDETELAVPHMSYTGDSTRIVQHLGGRLASPE